MAGVSLREWECVFFIEPYNTFVVDVAQVSNNGNEDFNVDMKF